MIFALLFFVSFVIGVVVYVTSDRWWLAGTLCSLILLLVSAVGLNGSPFQSMALYFGVPIVFLGSLFGAYIVQLRRAPELDDSIEDAPDAPAETEVFAEENATETRK